MVILPLPTIASYHYANKSGLITKQSQTVLLACLIAVVLDKLDAVQEGAVDEGFLKIFLEGYQNKCLK